MEKIKFDLHKPRKNQTIFINEIEENKILFEYFGDFREAEKEDKIMNYEEALRELHQRLLTGFEIMAV